MRETLARGQFAAQALAYWIDAWQRFEQYRECAAEKVPHVLDYEAELVCDGRTLGRPVNYCLVRIVPPNSVGIAPAKRPFVVVDPCAGHGAARRKAPVASSMARRA